MAIEHTPAGDTDESLAEYDVYNVTTKERRIVKGTREEARRRLNELIAATDDWVIVRLPSGGTGAGSVVDQGRGPLRSS